MRIQHNIAAQNSYRQLGGNNSALSKNLEKLSSGYRINRAGDDAAGLAISEKMRAQITGLATAQKNANDGISLVQTAEGALTEVHSMLNRMSELATQSANGTYDNDVDRANLQKEVESLKSEIDRIAEGTNFNGINLLDGSLAGSSKVNGGTGEGNGKLETVLNVGTTGLGDPTRVEAGHSKTTFANGASNAAAGDKMTISFTANGKDYSIGLTYSGSATTIKASDVAKALNGDTSVTTLKSDTDAETLDALKAFKNNFNVSASGAITSKTTGSDSARITDIKTTNAAGTAAPTHGVTFSTASGANVKGADAAYEIVVPATASKVAGGMFKVGDKSIVIDKEESVDSILQKLKEAGVDAKIKAGTSSTAKRTIQITDNAAIKGQQTGTGIEVKADGMTVTSDAATNLKTSITIAGTGSEKQSLKINYTDANGKNQVKELTYTAGTSASKTAEAIKKAIGEDSEFSELFSIKATGSKIEFETKVAGTGGASVIGMSSDLAGFTATAKTETAALDKGTILEFNNNSVGKAGNFKLGDTVTVNGRTYEFTDGVEKVGEGNAAITLGASKDDNFAALEKALQKDGIDAKYDKTSGQLRINDFTTAKNGKGEGLVLQVGDTSDDYQKVTVSVDDMSSKSLKISDVNISSQKGASDAIGKIKSAINSVSSTRGDLGAIQNRLEHTINNLGVTEENMTSAESRIRDTDMASEMMKYTKNNILIQASQAMLAQANQLPQGVLQLLG
ncbi:MAG: flagellin [Aminipila sp.]